LSTAPLSLIVNLSAISYLEVLYGCRNSGELNNASRMVVDLFAKVLPLTENISETAQQLMERFVLSRRPEPDDVLIAQQRFTGTNRWRPGT